MKQSVLSGVAGVAAAVAVFAHSQPLQAQSLTRQEAQRIASDPEARREFVASQDICVTAIAEDRHVCLGLKAFGALFRSEAAPILDDLDRRLENAVRAGRFRELVDGRLHLGCTESLTSDRISVDLVVSGTSAEGISQEENCEDSAASRDESPALAPASQLFDMVTIDSELAEAHGLVLEQCQEEVYAGGAPFPVSYLPREGDDEEPEQPDDEEPEEEQPDSDEEPDEGSGNEDPDEQGSEPEHKFTEAELEAIRLRRIGKLKLYSGRVWAKIVDALGGDDGEQWNGNGFTGTRGFCDPSVTDCAVFTCQMAAEVAAVSDVMSRHKLAGCNEDVEPDPENPDACYGFFGQASVDEDTRAELASAHCRFIGGFYASPVEALDDDRCIFEKPGVFYRSDGVLEGSICDDPRAQCNPEDGPIGQNDVRIGPSVVSFFKLGISGDPANWRDAMARR